jgi:hypothetical protein
LAAAIEAHPTGPSSQFEGYEVAARTIEAAVADFTALIRAIAQTHGHSEYEVSVGIEWTGPRALMILTVDNSDQTYDGNTTPLGTFTRVQLTMNTAVADDDFHRQVYDLAEYCINQGGITHLHEIKKPDDGADVK